MPPDANSDSDLPTAPQCAVCGTRLENRLGAQCPRCLLSFATTLGLSGEGDAADDDLLDSLQVRRFGDYELLEEIARGGMGIVYRARQLSLGREVAIKMIIAGELAGKTALRMFQIEAHAAAKLNHPNIVPVHEIGEYETQHYFTMRFVPGGRTIADWAGEKRGDHRALAAAAARVAWAVEHAHTRSILHRDLKPSNILWDRDDGPQVTDFGLAKVLDQADVAVTRTVLALGSPSYMAPEQMDGRSAEITTATDVYGVGAVLYEMLTGRPPFAGTSALDTMRRVAEQSPAALPGVPDDLRAICLHCLEKAPADRYHSAAALAEDLERFARGEPVSVVPLSAPEILWRWARRRPAIAALLAACGFFLLAGVAGIVWQWQKTEQARAEQAIALEHLQWQGIDRWLNEEDASRALAYLASLIRQRPDRWPAVMYAMSIVEQNAVPVLSGPAVQPPVPLTCEAQLDPDGRWLAGAGEDQIVRIWDVETGKETAQLPQRAPVTAVAIGAGPVKLAVAMQDGTIALYPSFERALDHTMHPGTVPIVDLQFSTDGARLLARGKANATVWRSGPDSEPLILSLEDGEVSGARLSADGGRVLLWNGKEAAVWNTDTGSEVWRAAAQKSVRHAALSADGTRVALLDGQFTARVWDLGSDQPFPAVESPHMPFSFLALDTTGRRLTAAGIGNDLKVFDVSSGLPVSPPMKHHYGVTRLLSSPDGRRTISYGREDAVNVWDASTGHTIMNPVQLGTFFRSGRIGLTSSSDGRRVLLHTAAEKDAPESISVWHGTTLREPQRRSVEGTRDLNPGRMSRDERFGCLSLTPGDRCFIYELATDRVVLDQAVKGPPYVHLFSLDGSKYYMLTANGWLYGWSLETGVPLWEPHHENGLVRPGSLSPDGTRIIAGHNDGHIRVYDTATGGLVQTLDHPGEVKVLRFAPDKSGRFVSGSTDQLAHVWDLATGRKLQTFTGHGQTIITAAWSPDSRQIATGSYDQTARMWDVATGQPIGPVLQHSGSLAHLEYSPDGIRIATACRDGTARLWDARSGQPASPPLAQGSAVESVRFTADGSVFLVRDHDGFRFWDTASGEPVTVHYPEATVSGLGMDSENYRGTLARDGRHVFLTNGMNYGAYWSISQPRKPAPSWFPEFLEMLAQVRINERGDLRPVPLGSIHSFEAPLRDAPIDDEYAEWARRVLQPAGW